MAIYQVQRGDNLYSIAEAVYGDRSKWRDVARVMGQDPNNFGRTWGLQTDQIITVADDSPYGITQELFFANLQGREPAGWALESAPRYGVNPADYGFGEAAAPAEEPATAEAPAPAPEPQPVAAPAPAEPEPTPVQLVTPVEPEGPPPETVIAEPVAEPAPAPMEEPEPEPTGPTEAQESAYDIFEQELDAYGLSSLADFLYDLVFVQGYSDRDIIRAEIRRTNEYQTRFYGNTLRAQNGYNALSEPEYIGMENAYAQLMRSSGLPAGFYDQTEDFNTLIGENVSVQEVTERVNTGYEAVANADPEVIAEMRRLYNIGDGELAAYFLDPERALPTLLRQAKAAEVAGGAIQAGVTISAAEAETLAEEGITQQGARAGFGVISEGDIFQMTTEEIAAGEQALTREEQIGAVFGTDPQAAQRLRRQQRRRQAAFEAGGRFAGAGQEITGLR